jgi:hypothetical protein
MYYPYDINNCFKIVSFTCRQVEILDFQYANVPKFCILLAGGATFVYVYTNKRDCLANSEIGINWYQSVGLCLRY